MNYRMLLQYDGTRYDGWQKQGNTDNTIQGKVEAVLEKMTGEKVEVHGAGRTDAGVHAAGQVIHARLSGEHDPEEICEYLNKYLPDDIGVLKVERTSDRFHARLNAAGKIYVYRIGTGRGKNVFERKYLYPLREELDCKAMRQAAKALLGTHDFRSFCTNKKIKKSAVRSLDMIHIEEKTNEIAIIYQGDGFLYNMIRILTGTLIEVGQGKRKISDMAEILESKDRQKAGATAPAQGLTLLKVLYEGDK